MKATRLAVLLAALALLCWLRRPREDWAEPDDDEPDYGQPDVYVESAPCACGGEIAIADIVTSADVMAAVQEHQQSLRHLQWRRRREAA